MFKIFLIMSFFFLIIDLSISIKYEQIIQYNSSTNYIFVYYKITAKYHCQHIIWFTLKTNHIFSIIHGFSDEFADGFSVAFAEGFSTESTSLL